jgi:hypothetical protein
MPLGPGTAFLTFQVSSENVLEECLSLWWVWWLSFEVKSMSKWNLFTNALFFQRGVIGLRGICILLAG